MMNNERHPVRTRFEGVLGYVGRYRGYLVALRWRCASSPWPARCMCPFSPATRWICCWGPARWILRRCWPILAGILALVALTALAQWLMGLVQ